MAAIPHIDFLSLGCTKALVDEERILSQLRAEGYGISAQYDNTGIVVLNACGYIDATVEESLNTIR